MLSREMKVGIIGGVISSILVIIFIQPILSFMWSVILSFGESINARYVDAIYRNAALGARELSEVFTLLLLTVLFMMMFVHVFIEQSRLARPPIYYILILEGVVVIIFSFSALIVSSIQLGVIEISASFNQRLAVLTPAISDHECKEWRAQWAKMSGQADYRTLTASMDKRASDMKIQLPKVREP